MICCHLQSYHAEQIDDRPSVPAPTRLEVVDESGQQPQQSSCLEGG